MSKVNYIKKNNLGEDCPFQYYIELINREGEDVAIRGWVYYVSEPAVDADAEAKCAPVEVSLIDEAGNEIEESKVWRKTRKDVKKKFNLNDDYKAEFLIRFNREAVTDETIYICLNDLKIPINMPGLDMSFTTGGKILSFLSDHPLKRTAKYIARGGLASKISSKLKNDEDAYTVWRRTNTPSDADYNRQRETKFDYEPVISISIPLYNTPMEFFEALMNSIMGQTYKNFELCLADGSDTDALGAYISEHYPNDSRIHYTHLPDNLGIAGNTNKALEMATGDFVMLTDHDDILDISALYEIVSALNNARSAGNTIDIIYTDEDLVDASGMVYSNYRFKPDFNYEMLRHLNYICHIFVVRREIMNGVGGFREEYDGAQDFDMILRCCEATQSEHIHHIPKILYHWRAHEDSTAGNVDSKQYAIDASVRALQEHLQRVGIDAEVEATDIFIMLKSTRRLANKPLVSILIPNKDHIEDLNKCITSIIDKSTYDNYEIIVIENNSTEDETFAYYDNLCQRDVPRDTSGEPRIKVVTWDPAGSGFNYSKINNYGATFASGDYYILLNNDIEVKSPDWIERMLAYCVDPKVGAVGAKLLYPDDTVQHCGIVIGVGGFAGHILTESTNEDVGYFGRLQVQQEVSAVTAACLMIDAAVWREIGGFDEDFAVALNDVDLCLKVRDKGYKIMLDPNVQMYHYESKSRGYEETKEQITRFKREIKRFRDKWSSVLEAGDPYYSPNLTLDRGDCSPRRVEERFLIIEELE